MNLTITTGYASIPIVSDEVAPSHPSGIAAREAGPKNADRLIAHKFQARMSIDLGGTSWLV